MKTKFMRQSVFVRELDPDLYRNNHTEIKETFIDIFMRLLFTNEICY